jgi:hypothetical protein
MALIQEMKKILFINAFLLLSCFSFSQEALKIQNGGSITIQNGVQLALQGGLTLDNGSSLVNNGIVSLKNNAIANLSNWTDNSILGALTGTGIVIFNSTHPQQFTGTTDFYTIYINTNELTLNNDLSISNLLRLIQGKITTGNNVVFLINTAAASLENDATNAGYTNSWINGFLKRSIATNTGSYDFPVGIPIRSNLLQFINNNIIGPSSLTASVGPKIGTDVGLNVVENGNTYTAVNIGGVWKLVPNTAATGGNYALHLYFNGFTGLADNRFGILRRPDASSNAADWIVPTGSLLEPLNGAGRKVSDGFARRYNISDFSQFGIGESTLPTPCQINGQSAVCIGSSNNIYSGPPGMTTYLWSVTGATIVGSNTAQSVSISFAGAGGFTLNLTTTLNGVTAQCSKTVNVSSITTCDIIGPNELCSGLINGYLGPVNMLTYSWTTSPGLTIMGPNTNALVSVTSSTPGPQMLTLNATGIGGCTSQCTKIIQVIPVVPCSITGASNVTAGTTNNQYAGPANMTSYNWSVNGNGTIVGSNTGSSVNVTAGAAGTFTLTLTTTLASCSTSCSKTVTVDPTTTYSCAITGPSEACKGSLDIFTAPSNLNSYTWNVTGNASIIGPNTSASVTVGATIPGSYTISLQTMLNGVACSSAKTVNVIECANACTYTQGFYGNRKGNACYNNTGTTMNSSELMLNAFGVATSQVFGNVANKRFFTLFKSDISSGAIYKMLPGGGNAKAIDVDNVSPFDGAYYADETTWALVPLQSNNPQKGRIRNLLLAQTITLWFNLRNSSSLGSISLVNDTLVTQGTTKCGSSSLVGEPDTVGLPHSIVAYLNGSNGYPATVTGLFALANDVLGGVNTSMSPSEVTEAVDIINNAFDECSVLVETIPYSNQLLTRNRHTVIRPEEMDTKALKVIAYPNPYQHRFQLIISSPVTGRAKMEFYSVSGQKVYEMDKPVTAGFSSTILYTGSVRFSSLFYKVTIEKYVATGIVLKPN